MVGVLAVVESLETDVVLRRHVEAGIVLAQYYIGEALRLFEQATDTPYLVLAEQLLDWLRQQNSLTSPNCLLGGVSTTPVCCPIRSENAGVCTCCDGGECLDDGPLLWEYR